jgi:hypothetical protein
MNPDPQPQQPGRTADRVSVRISVLRYLAAADENQVIKRDHLREAVAALHPGESVRKPVQMTLAELAKMGVIRRLSGDGAILVTGLGEIRRRLASPNRWRLPRCRKRKFNSRVDALLAITAATRRGNRRPRDERRTYLCDAGCNAWHLTSKGEDPLGLEPPKELAARAQPAPPPRGQPPVDQVQVGRLQTAAGIGADQQRPSGQQLLDLGAAAGDRVVVGPDQATAGGDHIHCGGELQLRCLVSARPERAHQPGESEQAFELVGVVAPGGAPAQLDVAAGV